MRLHRLSVTAFGPFADTEVVDFDALGADGLFLIHGDTGAGKTTVLDAVAYALFGRVPGARQDARRLRSDHAAPGVRPVVELELTVGGSRVVVTRSPDWARPKRRGAGTTPEKASATLRFVEDPGRSPVTRIDEVARVTERLVGMSVDQFTQVVLLPQGEFARFLRAETADRESLLEQLFGTERFGRVEDWFRERRRAAWGAVQDGAARIDGLAARLSQVAAVEQPAAVDEGWLADTARELGSVHARAATADDGTSRELAQTDARLAGARRRADQVRRRVALEVRARALADRNGAAAGAAAALDAARRAAPVAVLDADADRARLAADRTTTAAAVALRAVGPLPDLPNGGADGADRAAAATGGIDGAAAATGGIGPEQLRGAAAAWRAEAGRLTSLVERLTADERAGVQAGELAGLLAQERGKLAAVEQRAATVPDLLEAARARLADAVAAAGRAGPAASAVRVAADVLAAGGVRDSTAARLVDATAAVADHRADEQAARESWLDLRERRLDGMAGELAGRLADGVPCPVCGAAEHPSPARPVPGAVTAAGEDAARATVERGRDALERAEAELAGLRADLRAARAVAGQTPLPDLAAAVAATRALAAAESDRAARWDAAEQEVRDLGAEDADLDRERRILGARLATGDTRLAAFHDARAGLAAEADRVRGGDPDVPARQRRLVHQAGTAEAAGLALDRVAATGADALDRTTRAGAAAVDAGFPDPGAARAAALDPPSMAALASTVAATAAEQAAVADGLAAPDLAGVDPAERVDLDAAAAAAAAAATARDRTRRDLTRAEHAAVTFADLTAQWRRAEQGHAPVRTAYAELAALTEVVDGRGQNSSGLSLRSYVLAARLEEVATAASGRLSAMSGGRYELVRGAGTGRRGSAGGLGLDVADTWTGLTRPTKTLSGGESFLASLALALALADVVAAESGGVVLDTLFVDEGFGTLDPEALDLVMGTLDELRAGGRVVGLVSHVAELRDRIPSRLFVHRGRTGSTLSSTAA